MHTSIFISTAAVLALGVTAQSNSTTREETEIRALNIYPAQKCGESFTGFNPCDPDTYSKAPPSLATNNNSYVPCGDGAWCMNAACGRWAGKDNHCCSGVADRPLESIAYPKPEDLRLVCEPYRDILKDYDPKDKGEAPIKGGGKCQQKSFTENYPVGLVADDFIDIVTGKKTYDKCCSFAKDSIMIYSDAVETLESTHCIPPLGKGKELNMKEIEERDRENVKNGMSGKSLGTTVIPSVIYATFAFVGVAFLGMI